MQEVNLEAEVREKAGKEVAHLLRSQGRVPAILYGRQKENVKISIPSRDFFHLIHGQASGNVVIRLQISGSNNEVQEEITIIRDIQYDPVTEKILHVDFFRISLDEAILSEVPLQVVGTAAGVKAGGVIEHALRTLEVRCLPLDIPDVIEVDVTPLEIGQSLHVRDLKVPDDVEVITSPDATAILVAAPTVVVEPEPVTEEEALLEEGEVPEGEGEGEGETPAEEKKEQTEKKE